MICVIKIKKFNSVNKEQCVSKAKKKPNVVDLKFNASYNNKWSRFPTRVNRVCLIKPPLSPLYIMSKSTLSLGRARLNIPFVWNGNKAILEELGITQRLSSIVQARILTFFGHVSRRDNDSIERLVVHGRIEGTRSRGRSPMRWADQIQAAVAVPLHECARKAAAREEWRRIVKRATTLK
ncbi:jg14408 [Pararge aegeria aegeria]|uniref:Jg14408 protein n=1 Tax=Pararge aegeria aegeria TaxID=348720 RepID=A0A8S4RYW5_9NEOP|nr:jg14408 [Pararge aegeria aegeria]